MFNYNTIFVFQHRRNARSVSYRAASTYSTKRTAYRPIRDATWPSIAWTARTKPVAVSIPRADDLSVSPPISVGFLFFSIEVSLHVIENSVHESRYARGEKKKKNVMSLERLLPFVRIYLSADSEVKNKYRSEEGRRELGFRAIPLGCCGPLMPHAQITPERRREPAIRPARTLNFLRYIWRWAKQVCRQLTFEGFRFFHFFLFFFSSFF